MSCKRESRSARDSRHIDAIPGLERVTAFIIRREVANGPVVFLERLDRHRLPTGWIELPVTGVCEVHDGRITLWHEYFDLATIQNQMIAAG